MRNQKKYLAEKSIMAMFPRPLVLHPIVAFRAEIKFFAVVMLETSSIPASFKTTQGHEAPGGLQDI